jgi:hypothetical protein
MVCVMCFRFRTSKPSQQSFRNVVYRVFALAVLVERSVPYTL